MANPSLSRQFTLTNFTWKLRANGHLNGEKIGAVNYLKLSRIPTDIRIYWNSTNNRDTAFSVDELVRGFKINERDETGNAKTLDNVWLWSEGEIPLEPLSDIIEIEYNGAGDLIEPLLGNKSGAIDKIEKVQVVSAIDKVLSPIKVVQQNNTQGYQIDDFYRFNANITQPISEIYSLNLSNESEIYLDYYKQTYKGLLMYNASYMELTGGWSFTEICYIENVGLPVRIDLYKGNFVIDGNFFDKETKRIKTDFVIKTDCLIRGSSTFSVWNNLRLRNTKKYGTDFSSTEFFASGTTSKQGNKLKRVITKRLGMAENLEHEKNLVKIATPYIIKESNSTFSKEVEKVENNTFSTRFNYILLAEHQKVDVVLYEENRSAELSNFIFKTRTKITFLMPAQKEISFLSIIANNNKQADFRITLAELSKTSSQDCSLYIGGLDGGIKIPVKSGFELCFNNKKTGMDYAVIEIPAGDIYKIELELLNVYEDTQDA